MVRRYVYDSSQGRVIEIPACGDAPTAKEQYDDVEGHYREVQRRTDGSAEMAGKQLRDAALERASRREFAHRRYGDEGRWHE